MYIKNAGNLPWPQETHVPRNEGLGQTFIHVQAFYLLNKTYNLYNAVIRKGDYQCNPIALVDRNSINYKVFVIIKRCCLYKNVKFK